MFTHYTAVLKKYADFNGRATRSEYWYFVLVNILINIGISIIGAVVRSPAIFNIIGLVYGLAVLIPSLAVGFRRLHDTGRSAWWVLIGLIPIIGGIVLIIFMIGDSAPGANKYGPNPKEAKAA